MDTVRIDKKNCRLIAHRGVSGLERENTCPAFVAAGVKSYYGIETDVHVTGDGKYIICHDDNVSRVAGVDMKIEKSSFADLRALRLTDTDGKTYRSDLVLPTLEDYLAICRKYGKVAFLELKNETDKEHIDGIFALVKDMGWLDHTTFISFNQKNLVALRKKHERVSIQFLTDRANEENFCFMNEYRIDADLCGRCVNGEYVARLHAAGLLVNCWTIDRPQDAAKLIEAGVDFITTNILE